ncbi:choice-of-anchor J domain-containing protein [Duganella sp. S19_KUP01_CR8]|uniref:choice-of-anchor J domain-containing protein n=1 Tax=Duganella sp. S19_KUP01_CR8 TaxID=3025502 RepID=UPI002FCDBE27
MDLIKRWAGLLAVAAGCTVSASAAPLLNEGFNDITALSANGWVFVNNSSPSGSTSWFQGEPAIFAAAAGPSNAYIGANFNNAAFGGAVSNWLLTPELALLNGESLNFSLRLLGEGFLDTVEVYLSTGGASTSLGGFNLLGTFASAADTGWIDHAITVGGLTAPASGRFAFRYVVDDTRIHGDYIGIDTVSVNAIAIPVPGTIALLALGLCALAGVSRGRRPANWLALSGLALAATAAQAVPDNGLMTFPYVNVVAQQAAPQQTATADAGGLKAYKDPATGKLGSPNPDQAAELDKAIRASAAGPKSRLVRPAPIHPPHGGVGVMLDEAHTQYSVVHKNPTAQGEQK